MNLLSRMEREEAVLIIIDVQEVLMRQMDQEVGKRVIRNILTLLAFAKGMAVPILITEQYPTGLGKTVPENGTGGHLSY
jgi:isochorismate hydrolase